MAKATQKVKRKKRTVSIGVNRKKKSSGNNKVQSYTRTVNGKTVKVSGYSRQG